MNYKTKMFSLKSSVVTVAAAGLCLTLIAGCKTAKPEATPAPATTPPVVETNKPAPAPTPMPAHPTAPSNSNDSMATNILAWDSTSKEYFAQPGEKFALFTFSLTNVSTRPIVIYDTQTSCDCTVAKLPSQPWTIPSGGTGEIGASINLSNKTGIVTNYVIVFTSRGNRQLNVKATVPAAK